MAKRKAAEAKAAAPAAKQPKQAKKQEAAAPAAAPPAKPEYSFKNREKVLVLSSRGITERYRHLMMDFMTILPHCKKDAKFDDERKVINEIADMKGCTSCIYFECRKHKDLYIYFAKCPAGPTIKFHVTNVHTMAELKLSGNHLRGSRPVLSFHKEFDEQPHLQVMKEIFSQIFGTPRGHRKSKPFLDHVLGFTSADGRIWIRNYQLAEPADRKKVTLDDVSLVEVGPRFVMNPVKIFAGSFGGAVLYENPEYVSPNMIRSMEKREKQGKYGQKIKAKQRRKEHEIENAMQRGEFDGIWKEEDDE